MDRFDADRRALADYDRWLTAGPYDDEDDGPLGDVPANDAGEESTLATDPDFHALCDARTEAFVADLAADLIPAIADDATGLDDASEAA